MYIAQILIAFACQQDFMGTKTINQLSDPQQQLTQDGFFFHRYASRKNGGSQSIYMKCQVLSCACTKRIDETTNQKGEHIYVVVYEGKHNHPSSVIFNHDKYIVSLSTVYRLDSSQQMLINISNTKPHDNNNNFDYEDQGVLNALTQYVTAENKQTQPFELNEEDENKDGADDNFKHLFPHI